MKDFADATFEPEVVEAMTVALQQAIESLAEPISTASIDRLAESILRSAKSGEHDPAGLQRITPRT